MTFNGGQESHDICVLDTLLIEQWERWLKEFKIANQENPIMSLQ